MRYSLYKNNRDCKSCQHFGKCTTNRYGRSISVSEHRHLIDKMRERLRTAEGKKIYGRRKTIVEPVLGNLSQNLGFREFNLRGREKTRGEFSLMCIAHNLRKIWKVVKEIGMRLKELLRKRGLLPVFDTS